MAAKTQMLTHDAIRQRCRDIEDWKVAAIEEIGGDLADLDAALAWIAGESDVMGKERRPLEAEAARIYDILSAGEDDWEDM